MMPEYGKCHRLVLKTANMIKIANKPKIEKKKKSLQ